MQVRRSIARTLGAALLTAGLAYPACAAVCPKGIGGCTSPGRCFLYVDADANSLCDYTGRTGSQSSPAQDVFRPEISSQPSTQVQSSVTTVPYPAPTQASSSSAPGVTGITQDTTITTISNASQGGVLDSIHISAPLTEVLLFLVFTGICYLLFRRGVMGIQVRGTLPTLALSSLFGLTLSLIATSILAGGAVAGTVFALVYMTAGTTLVAYLWHTGAMTRKIVLLTAGCGALAGFIFVAPIMPMELGGIVTAVTGTSALTVGTLVICATIVIAFIIGRVFCSSICPMGSVQELAYAVPVKKIGIRRTYILEFVRLALFAATAITAIYLVDLMAVTGLYDLFSLTITAGFFIAAGILLLSVFLYRPVCRILCPFGVLFSIFSEFSRFWLQRTETCIGCRRCERVCPTRSAGEYGSKRECYLCGRCTAVCPEKTAIRYNG